MSATASLLPFWPFLLGLPIGFLIGLAGVGGVLVVPLLSQLAGLGERDAIATSLASFICLGAFGAYARIRERMPSAQEWLLYAALIPAAALGAFALGYISNFALSIFVAASTLATGVWSIAFTAPGGGTAFAPGLRRSAAYGCIAGSVSALTGTGGPLVLMPLLLWQGVFVREALGISKAAQLPIALTATIARAHSGSVDFTIAAILSATLIAGMGLGSRAAAIVSPTRLRHTIGYVLAGVGLALLVTDAFTGGR